MARSLQKLLIFSLFLLILSSVQSLSVARSAADSTSSNSSSFHKAKASCSSYFLAVPFFHHAPILPGNGGEKVKAGNASMQFHKQAGERLSLNTLLLQKISEEQAGRQLLYILYRNLRQ